MDTENPDGPHGDNPPTSVASPTVGSVDSTRLDLDGIERDLASVEVALSRLDAGTYWTDEVTAESIPDATLAADPLARRV